MQVLPSLASTYLSTQAHVAVLFTLSRHSCSQLPLLVSQGVEAIRETQNIMPYLFDIQEAELEQNNSLTQNSKCFIEIQSKLALTKLLSTKRNGFYTHWICTESTCNSPYSVGLKRPREDSILLYIQLKVSLILYGTYKNE